MALATEEVRQALQRKLDSLQQRLKKIDKNFRTVADPDSQEQASNRENDEVLERLDSSGREEIAMIEAALARIDAGTYGVCVSCGKMIQQQRLVALPYTMVCLSCAR
jgi:RNA polymerase-binding transcription factor DksA